ncbi:DUF2157 domain-containing protein [Oleisolibacter albus]|uniref:DUF2157 domain-containing protein n=1 Tax=Oleisolibacter albus TaxID=2171757 RepID=UPI00138FE6EE|nr:DUF2157 domain-containing protein [Oleisolibacter albus]
MDRRLTAWTEAGLIDAATAARIRAFEAGQARPGLSHGLAVLGSFAMALGLVAIISANWDAIPVWLKLGTHLLLNLGLGAAAWIWAEQKGSLRLEAVLLLLSASTLALIGHIGQSFHLQGGPTGLLGGWLLLVTPFTLALARHGLHRGLWTLGLLLFLGSALSDHADRLAAHHLFGAALVLPMAVVLAARIPLARLDHGWADQAAALGRASALALPSLLLLTDGFSPHDLPDGTGQGLLVMAGAGILLLAAELAAGPTTGSADRRRRWPLALLLGLCPALAALPGLIALPGHGLAQAMLFCLLWITVAALSLHAQRPGLYRLAVTLVALRVFIVFLDAAAGLMTTGLGLILAGAVLILLGAAARRAMAWGRQRIRTGEG